MSHEPSLPWVKINDFLLQVCEARDLNEFNRLVRAHVADLIPHDYPIFSMQRFDGIYDSENPADFASGFDKRNQFLDAGLALVGESHAATDYNQFYRFNLPIPHGYFRHQPFTDFRPFSNTAFFNDFIKPRNIGLILGGWFRSYTVVIPRTKPARPFSEQEQSILQIIAPHLENFYNMLSLSVRRHTGDTSVDRSLGGMTRREIDIAGLVALGKTNSEIANDLFISGETVKRHLYNIFGKMKVKNRTQLVRKLLTEDLDYPPGVIMSPVGDGDGF